MRCGCSLPPKSWECTRAKHACPKTERVPPKPAAQQLQYKDGTVAVSYYDAHDACAADIPRWVFDSANHIPSDSRAWRTKYMYAKKRVREERSPCTSRWGRCRSSRPIRSSSIARLDEATVADLESGKCGAGTARPSTSQPCGACRVCVQRASFERR